MLPNSFIAELDAQLKGFTSRRVNSSLFLQQLLYYNVYFSAGWFVFFAAHIFHKYGKGISLVDPDLVRSILAALWIAAEPLRLWCGWYSNLGENIPWLVIFLVLTAAPQTAVVYYLMLAQQDLRAVDQAVQVVQAIFIHLEMIAALATIARVYQRRRERYFLVEHALKQGVRELVEQQQAAAAAAASGVLDAPAAAADRKMR